MGVLTSRIFNGPILSAYDAEGLVVRYNERLRDHIQSEDASPVMARNEPPRLLPFLAPGGAGIVLDAVF